VCAEFARCGGSSLPVNLPLSLPSDTLFPSEGERDRVRGSPAGSGAHCALNIRRVPSSRVRGVDGSTATWCRISKALISQSAETTLSTDCTYRGHHGRDINDLVGKRPAQRSKHHLQEIRRHGHGVGETNATLRQHRRLKHN